MCVVTHFEEGFEVRTRMDAVKREALKGCVEGDGLGGEGTTRRVSNKRQECSSLGTGA